MRNNPKYHYLLTLLFFTVSFIGISNHELWLDEAQHWLLARDSHTFIDLLNNTQYEGHPILWNIILYGITRFTLDPFWMQLVHISIATSAVFIFLRKAPFSLLFKALFIFGYFMIFEYNLISRNYILGILFLFLACSVFKDRDKKFVLLSVYLALAANVHLMFSTIAFGMFLILLFEIFTEKKALEKRFLPGYLIFAIGSVLLFLQLLPANSGWFFPTLENIPLSEKFTKGFISLFKGLIAIPDFTSIHFWNSNLLINVSKPLSAILGIMLYGIPLILLKKRNALLFAYIALLGTQIFFFITQRGATRFDGMTYIIIILSLWIDNYYDEENGKLRQFLNASKLSLLRNSIIYSILLIQFMSGMYANAMDFNYSFTASKEVSDYLTAKKLKANEIVSVTCDGTAISPYLEKKIYFLCEESNQSFCHWDLICATNISQERIVALLTNYMENNDYAVYASNYPIIKAEPNIWTTVNDKIKVRFLKKFDPTIIRNSYYYIFEVAKITDTK